MSIKSFLFGVLFAVIVFATINAVAGGSKPTIVGDDGIIEGVEVLGRDGRRICYEPQYFNATKSLSCE